MTILEWILMPCQVASVQARVSFVTLKQTVNAGCTSWLKSNLSTGALGKSVVTALFENFVAMTFQILSVGPPLRVCREDNLLAFSE